MTFETKLNFHLISIFNIYTLFANKNFAETSIRPFCKGQSSGHGTRLLWLFAIRIIFKILILLQLNVVVVEGLIAGVAVASRRNMLVPHPDLQDEVVAEVEEEEVAKLDLQLILQHRRRPDRI